MLLTAYLVNVISVNFSLVYLCLKVEINYISRESCQFKSRLMKFLRMSKWIFSLRRTSSQAVSSRRRHTYTPDDLL